MPIDRPRVASPVRRLRIDLSEPDAPGPRALPALAVAALAGAFVLFGGGSLDLGPIEARQGLAAGERFGPLGHVFGHWDPAVWPLRVLFSRVWAWFEGGLPTSAAVRWPDAIAAVALGVLMARRL